MVIANGAQRLELDRDGNAAEYLWSFVDGAPDLSGFSFGLKVLSDVGSPGRVEPALAAMNGAIERLVGRIQRGL